MTGLAGYLDLILAGSVDDPAVELPRRVHGARPRHRDDHRRDLVGDLLELSRLESGMTIERRAHSRWPTRSRTWPEGLDPIAMDRGIALRTTLPARLRAATGDRRRVEQVVTNLAAER